MHTFYLRTRHLNIENTLLLQRRMQSQVLKDYEQDSYPSDYLETASQNVLSDNLRDWLRDSGVNCTVEFYYMIDRDWRTDKNFSRMLRFGRTEDFLLFKLAWGGSQ